MNPEKQSAIQAVNRTVILQVKATDTVLVSQLDVTMSLKEWAIRMLLELVIRITRATLEARTTPSQALVKGLNFLFLMQSMGHICFPRIQQVHQ